MALKEGDKVSWNTPQGKTHGTVNSKHTKDLKFQDQTFRASGEDPVYLVESEKTGAEAAHHEKALDKR
ncbi:DUF2945 domain-containing protein [Nesterenkonia sp. DZ6]|uniref:DUF2945 domain-containing protein n=1 Tax=Nesterenkonia sp. DZ6 TaxID=2901229 RepID=UPI001F4CA01B|nr:DUF2945 domain-containing protein [Nesterenkonia sp. DZ6]MCH8560370.1 DUF2945 domain-containing protein [Nesterenkonia sp. DZ6]